MARNKDRLSGGGARDARDAHEGVLAVVPATSPAAAAADDAQSEPPSGNSAAAAASLGLIAATFNERVRPLLDVLDRVRRLGATRSLASGRVGGAGPCRRWPVRRRASGSLRGFLARKKQPY